MNEKSVKRLTGMLPSVGLPSKYLDMRVIGPSFVISFLWALYISFYIPATSIVEFCITSLSPLSFYTYPEDLLTLMGIILRISVFILDFLIVFALCYLFIWIFVRERDKRMYLQYKRGSKR
jgi:hypothetical protein